MNSKYTNYLLFGLVLAALVIGAGFYPLLPDQITSHWNASGEADDYMGKFWGVFLIPLIMAGVYLLYFLIPKIDPLRKNIETFRSSYNMFWIWALLFLFYIFGLSMVWNLEYRFNFTIAIIPALSALLYIVGDVLSKSKRNWFIGIRTPWTLSNDNVWEKTHKLGGKLFKFSACIVLLGLFTEGEYAIVILAVSVALVTVVTTVYSYLEYRKL